LGEDLKTHGETKYPKLNSLAPQRAGGGGLFAKSRNGRDPQHAQTEGEAKNISGGKAGERDSLKVGPAGGREKEGKEGTRKRALKGSDTERQGQDGDVGEEKKKGLGEGG